ncbi:MAG TPA: LuxR C-terminal-related transcriptional regulator [Streptosporangiaceae bacterium]|jgi:predicted ATPase/DNA-binding CsgD family transcriptional regulator
MTPGAERTEPGALPAEPNAFIGRERDVDDVCTLLAATRLVTLCGPGGIGKSRLALRIASRVAAGETALDDGAAPYRVYFVELADLDSPELIAARVAATMRITAEPGRSLEDTLVESLRHQRLLLVLDNCEHLVDGAARLSSTLLAMADGVRLVTTSREPLRVSGETVWRVPPLSLAAEAVAPDSDRDPLDSDAVRLFVARAAAARPEFRVGSGNASAVLWMCRALDGMPLAIELAAARVRVLSVEQIAARLDDRFRLLASGDRTAPVRQRTLRAAVDWSHDLLGERERVLFRRLSVFSGGWTLEMAERVCADPDAVALPEIEVLDRLADLVDKSLVTVVGEVGGEVWYRMLETIRKYAADRLVDAGERDELRARNLAYTGAYVKTVDERLLGRDPIPWDGVVAVLERLRAEQGNVRAVLTWALETGALETAMEIAAVLTRAFWIPTGDLTEGVRWVDRLIAADHAGVDPLVRARLLIRRADLALETYEFARARACAAEALPVCRAAGDDRYVLEGLLATASADLREGGVAEAKEHISAALAIARDRGEPWGLILGYSAAAMAALADGDPEEATRSRNEAMRAAREIGNYWMVGRMLLGLGSLAAARGDRRTARRQYEEAIGLLRGIDSRNELARCYLNLARVLFDDGEVRTAHAHLSEALRLSEAAGHGIAVARELELFAEVAERSGAPAEAARLVGAAERLRADLRVPDSTGHRVGDLVGRLRAELGADPADRMLARGHDMSRAEAVALAGAIVSGPVPPQRGASDAAEPAAPLTAREWEIARLLAQGLSNRAVADDLVISPATVARHVANILTKLDFTSRAQVAVWVIERDTGAEG